MDEGSKADSCKEKGNKYYKAGRYELAISNYSQAIKICPEGKNLELAIYYQNRAAAHEQLVSQLLVGAYPENCILIRTRRPIGPVSFKTVPWRSDSIHVT